MKILINDMLISPSWGPSSSLSHLSRGGFCSCRNFTRWNGIQIFTHWQFDRLWQYKNNLQVEWTSSWVSGNHHIYLWQPGRWWYIDLNWGDGFTRCTCPWTALDSPIHPRLRLKNLNIHGWSFFKPKIYFLGSKVVGKEVHIKSRFIDYFSKIEHLHIFGEKTDFFNPSLPSPGVAAAALILEQRRRGWRSQFNYISTMVHSMEDLDHIL